MRVAFISEIMRGRGITAIENGRLGVRNLHNLESYKIRRRKKFVKPNPFVVTDSAPRPGQSYSQHVHLTACVSLLD